MTPSTQALQVSPVEAFAMIVDGAILIDVREPEEWRAGHAAAAIHLPMADLAVGTQGLSRTAPMILICRSGRRSDQAVTTLVAAGHQALNLSGGMQAWQQAGGDVVRDDGTTGTVI